MNKLFTIFLALVTVSCGVNRQAVRNYKPTQQEQVKEQQRQTVGPNYKMLPSDTPSCTAVTMPEICFQPLEYQHVRVRGVNPPLPIDGLKIRLDDLADEFTYPVRGEFISDYGMRRGRPHTGIDIRASRGDTIRAALPGVVRMSKLYSSYGNIVVIRHYNGLETVYSHNTRNLVSPDDVVLSGQPIALAGRTGRATTDHLHFEVRAAGEPIDPKLMVDPKTMSLRNGWLFINEKNGRIIVATSVAELEANTAKTENDLAATATARDTAIANSQTAAVQTPEPAYYTVKRGDVLGRIAQKHQTTVTRLCSLNNLPSPDKIREGQRLRVR